MNTQIVTFVALLAAGPSAFPAGTVRQFGPDPLGSNISVLAFRWTGDPSTGSVPVTAASRMGCCQGYVVSQIEVSPGHPAPSSGYSVQVTDGSGLDVLAGAGGSLSSTTPQSFAGASSTSPVQGTLSLVVDGQRVPSAQGTVYVTLSKPGTVNPIKIGASSGSNSP